MKVVVTTRLYAPEVGAAAFRLKALVDGLVAQGAEVKVLTTQLPLGAPVFKPSYKLSRWPVLRDSGGYVRGYLQYLSFDIPAFFRLLVTKADVVVCEPPPTTGVVVAISSLIRRRPYVYYAADIWSEALSAMDVAPIVKKVLGRAEGFVLRRAAQVIAVSEPVAEQVAKFNVPADRIVVVGNGVDTNIFTPKGNTASAERPYFIYTGTMSEWQGADIFVQALPIVREHFPDAEIIFFGQGTDEEHLKEVSNELAPGGVRFGGVVQPGAVAEWIRGAAGALVSIKPGQGYDFAKPTKIYAAAGCGVPVVFAGQGAGAAIVEEGGLGIVAPYNVGSVAAAMVKMLEEAPTGARSISAIKVEWVRENASLIASGKTAASLVLGLHK
ncbi:glycosyltransferase family 4 protein [Arthrobacter antibioticus]|uniref:glycosyltransferase family 4 protein n=1 Tax=Arthrobacter sp. H35-MC1 TaxID=3046203 RepID=UPI0024BA327F|nr:glycosyltransferase family 4 protein [Arthrobacter sp. H35-MC1]MDJ0316470.1 glycosyltransferase family 4 protein [Arthrobacter sp. H35-MC1]